MRASCLPAVLLGAKDSSMVYANPDGLTWLKAFTWHAACSRRLAEASPVVEGACQCHKYYTSISSPPLRACHASWLETSAEHAKESSPWQAN